MQLGQFGLPQGHEFAACFTHTDGTYHKPAYLTVRDVESLDPEESDPARAYSSRITLESDPTQNFRAQPGQHATVVNTSEHIGFPPDFVRTAATQPETLGSEELERLRHAPIRNYSFASPESGADADSKKMTLLVRRVGSCSSFLVNRKPGDMVMVAAPISDAFLGPTNETPALLFGLGTSVAPYRGMLATRYQDAASPPAPIRLYINHRTPKLEYYGQELRDYEKNAINSFAYRPNFSADPDASNGVSRTTELIKQPEEAEAIFEILFKPNSQIYISGVLGYADKIVEALRSAADAIGPEMRQRVDTALAAALAEDRFHVEGAAARGIQTSYQSE